MGRRTMMPDESRSSEVNLANTSWLIVAFGEAEWSERRGGRRCLKGTCPDGMLCNVKRLVDVSGHRSRGGSYLAPHDPAGFPLGRPLTS